MSFDDTRIVLWCWPIDEVVPGDWALLDVAERDRANRFVTTQHKTRFIRAHGGMRRLLGLIMDQRPDELAIHSDGFGKPFLGCGGPNFSLSHSAGFAALAFGEVPKIGVDIEQVRPIEHDLLARDHFSPAECNALAALPPGLREKGFFSTWTRKEAYLKAIGVGLSAPLAGFTVSVTPGCPAALLHIDAEPEEAARWSMVSFVPVPGYVGAVAARGMNWQLERRSAREAL